MAERVAISNRRAFHDFHILDRLEAGIVLTGPEVKSVRAGHASLQESYARVEKEEVFLHGMHIKPYEHAHVEHDPLRKRKLLLRRHQIQSLLGTLKQKGYTLVPLKVYFKRHLVKVELGVATGKRQYDKREAIKRRDTDREIDRALSKTRGRQEST